MDTKIGLFSTDKDKIDKSSEADGKVVFSGHTFTMEYPELMQRLITPVDISVCAENVPTFRVKALWDTGSMTSCISDKMARRIGLMPVDKGVGVTPTGQTEIAYYFVDVSISKDMLIKAVRVAGFPLEKHDVDFLIGMDVISMGALNVKNVNGKTVFLFELTGE